MNPLWQWIIASTTVKKMTRHCRSCGRSQVVPRDKERQSVSCKSCGAKIPAAR